MEFLGKLGIDPKLLIAQMVNFGLLLWLLKKILYKPIIKRIEKDEEELRQATLLKEKLKIESDIFEKERKQKNIDLNKKTRIIIEEAESIAKEIKREAQEETRKEREAIIKQIKSRLEEIENAKKSKK